MKKILTFVASAAFATLVMVGVATILPRTARAEGSTTSNSSSTTKEKTYTYVAQPNDTYSQMARKAIQTYGINNKVKLSQAEIIAAETSLTIAGGSPELVIGQTVVIKESAVKDAVTNAQKLTPAQESAWNVYVAGVNFDTSGVGQAK